MGRGRRGGAGLWEAGGPHSPRPRLRVGSQGGMPTRSPPEAGLAGDESGLSKPGFDSDASGTRKSIEMAAKQRSRARIQPRPQGPNRLLDPYSVPAAPP